MPEINKFYMSGMHQKGGLPRNWLNEETEMSSLQSPCQVIHPKSNPSLMNKMFYLSILQCMPSGLLHFRDVGFEYNSIAFPQAKLIPEHLTI